MGKRSKPALPIDLEEFDKVVWQAIKAAPDNLDPEDAASVVINHVLACYRVGEVSQSVAIRN